MNNHPMNDLRYFVLFPKRYPAPSNQPKGTMVRGKYWARVVRKYDNTRKWITQHHWHWYLVTYADGRKELAYLRSLKLGISVGIYRGLIPRLLSFTQYANIKNIRLAF